MAGEYTLQAGMGGWEEAVAIIQTGFGAGRRKSFQDLPCDGGMFKLVRHMVSLMNNDDGGRRILTGHQIDVPPLRGSTLMLQSPTVEASLSLASTASPQLAKREPGTPVG
jgi:hypothetical protein